MNVCFKALGKRERDVLKALGVRGIPDPRGGFGRGSVVTIDGYIVLAFGYRDAVIYQDGSGAIPDLIRAHRRVSAAFSHLSAEDFERIRRKGRPVRSLYDILAEPTP